MIFKTKVDGIIKDNKEEQIMKSRFKLFATIFVLNFKSNNSQIDLLTFNLSL